MKADRNQEGDFVSVDKTVRYGRQAHNDSQPLVRTSDLLHSQYLQTDIRLLKVAAPHRS